MAISHCRDPEGGLMPLIDKLLKSLFRFVLRSPSATIHTPQNLLTDYPINSPARHKPKCDTANNVLVSESERDPINTSALPFASDCNSAWHLL